MMEFFNLIADFFNSLELVYKVLIIAGASVLVAFIVILCCVLGHKKHKKKKREIREKQEKNKQALDDFMSTPSDGNEELLRRFNGLEQITSEPRIDENEIEEIANERVEQKVEEENVIPSVNKLGAYDFSDFEYSLYNAFGKVYSEEIGEVIRGGAVSDSGYYALITSSEQYNTAVELYDDTFSLAYRFNKNQFVTDIDINDNYLLITSVSASSENSYDMEIHVFDIIAQKVLFSTLARNNFPLECGIFAGGFAVIGDNYTSFYDFEGNIIGSFDYEGREPVDLSLNDGNTVILFRSNSSDAECISVILDDSCSLRYEHLLSEKVHDVEVCGEWSYYLMNDRLIYTNGNDLYDIPLKDINEGDKLLSLDDKSIYLCTVSKAPLFDLSID